MITCGMVCIGRGAAPAAAGSPDETVFGKMGDWW